MEAGSPTFHPAQSKFPPIGKKTSASIPKKPVTVVRGQSIVRNERRLSHAPPIHPKFTKNVKSLSFTKEVVTSKKFKLIGIYPMIQKALESRGWFNAKDGHESSVDLLFTTMIKDINHKELRPRQIANHFSGVTNYCMKSGLRKTMSELVWTGIDSTEFAPMTFCIPEDCSFEHFTRYYSHLQVG